MVTVHGVCDDRVSEVRVLVEAAQISEAMEAPDVRVRVAADHTFTGIAAIAEASEVDALFVFVFTAAVPAVIAELIDDDAV
jgi:hypothetical protein